MRYGCLRGHTVEAPETKETARACPQSCLARSRWRRSSTYSAYAAATAGGSYFFLDHTALGRQDAWEEPKGRADDPHGAVANFAT